LIAYMQGQAGATEKILFHINSLLYKIFKTISNPNF